MQISAGQNNLKKYNTSFGIKYTPQDYAKATKNYMELIKSDYNNPLNFVFSREFSIKKAIKATINYDKFVTEQVKNGKNIHSMYSDKDFKLIEGLQYGLKTFENMTMKGVFSFLNIISERKNFTLPVVRGCFHNCAHCFLGAKAPLERITFEDFTKFFKDLGTMSERIKTKINLYQKNSSLFYDSDGSQIFLTDKTGKEHEFPELAHIMHECLNTKAIFDTAGWNPKSEKIQKRMERFVEYYLQNPDRHERDLYCINLSVNPFESTYFTAIQQKRKGNTENFNKLKKAYVDMVVNMMHTFSPLFKERKVSFICRVFPDCFTEKELEDFKFSDMLILRREIISAYKEKYPQESEQNPEIIKYIKNRFIIHDDIGKTSRDNFLKKYSYDPFENRYEKEITKEELDEIKQSNNNVLLDMDGSLYLGDDYRLFKTDLKINFGNPKNKELELPVHDEIIEFQK